MKQQPSIGQNRRCYILFLMLIFDPLINALKCTYQLLASKNLNTHTHFEGFQVQGLDTIEVSPQFCMFQIRISLSTLFTTREKFIRLRVNMNGEPSPYFQFHTVMWFI